MPRLQAVVRPLAGKNRQNSPIPQVESKTMALLSRNFYDFSPFKFVKSQTAFDKHNTNAESITQIVGVKRLQTSLFKKSR